MKYIKYMCLSLLITIALTPSQIKGEEQTQTIVEIQSEIQTETQTIVEPQTEIQSEIQTEVQSEIQTEVQSEIQTEVQSETQLELNNNYSEVEGVLKIEDLPTTITQQPTTITQPTSKEVISTPPQINVPPKIEYIPNMNDYVNQDGFWVDKDNNVQTTPLDPEYSQENISKEPPKIDLERFNKTQWGIVSKGEKVQGAVTSNSAVSLANRIETMNANVETFSKRKVEFKPQMLQPLTTVTDRGVTPYQYPTPDYTFLITMFTIGGLCLLLSEYYAFVNLRDLKREKEESLKNGGSKHINISLPNEEF